jgi:hypothetical protein
MWEIIVIRTTLQNYLLYFLYPSFFFEVLKILTEEKVFLKKYYIFHFKKNISCQ